MSYADVNGSVHLYYEEHGLSSGQPLILVHGGLGSGEMFGPILPALAECRRGSRSTCRRTRSSRSLTRRR
jgi:pimeloyl-ACP methyl ester carboxylesterase